MVAPRPEEEFGPAIEFREYSFLQNHRLPAEVNSSRVRIEACAADDATGKCADGSGPAAETDAAVMLRFGLKDAQLKTALQVPSLGCFDMVLSPKLASTAWYVYPHASNLSAGLPLHCRGSQIARSCTSARCMAPSAVLQSPGQLSSFRID